MEEFKFKRFRADKMPDEKILGELEKASIRFNHIEFGWRDFDTVAGISAGLVKRRFGSWKKALVTLREHLQQKGINLSPRPYAPQQIHSEKELFDEMERIWKKIGQRPSRLQWEASEPKIAYNTYKRRYKGWTSACLRFIEYKMGEPIIVEDGLVSNQISSGKREYRVPKYEPESGRNISLRLRLKILEKNNFKCMFCGRSPVTDVGVRLHIDHVLPFAKGGKSTLENLQTLCQDCNLGKGDMIFQKKS